MTLMNILGFAIGDLEANQRGHLSSRQQQMLTCWPDADAAEGSLPMKVERVTGLVAIDAYHPSGTRGGDFHLRFGDRAVALLGSEAGVGEVNEIFEPGRIYTAYYVECAKRKLLLSVEEGPDWQGNTASMMADE